MNAAPGSAPTTYIATRRHRPGPERNARLSTISHAPAAPAMRKKFGRRRRPAAAVSPAANAEAGDDARSREISNAAHAAAGTSVIGHISMKSRAGLVATSHAAMSPVAGERTRRPIANVSHTSAPPAIGVIRNAAACPPTD